MHVCVHPCFICVHVLCMCMCVCVCSEYMRLLPTNRHNAWHRRRPVSTGEGNQERREGVIQEGKEEDKDFPKTELECREVGI